jgi:hypothetical protein
MGRMSRNAIPCIQKSGTIICAFYIFDLEIKQISHSLVTGMYSVENPAIAETSTAYLSLLDDLSLFPIHSNRIIFFYKVEYDPTVDHPSGTAEKDYDVEGSAYLMFDSRFY